MKFHKIKADRVVNLSTIRTAQVVDREIYITYICGDTRSDVIYFPDAKAANDAFNALISKLEAYDE